MRDTVRYRLPAGWLGSAAGGRLVASWVDRIFDYRARKIDERFGG
jgi:ligand-binding SRPBCC domain-containing protein